MEVKQTLLMPKTSFEMRGNLPNKEPALRQKWENEKLYHKMNERNMGKTPFILHDGPPYANGDMHIGHALNKVLKDFVIRYKSMTGHYTPFTPGWDTHGLPIENAVIKNGVNRKTTPVVEFRNKCEEYAHKQVLRQMEQQKTLGLMADYDAPYLTLEHAFEANEVDMFATLALNGLIYRGLKPVYWSPSSESALAEAEVEYYDKEDTSIYVKFGVCDGNSVLDTDTYFVIWTTTPWTIPANLAICLNESLEYGLFETSKGKLVFLTCLEEELTKAFELENVKLVKTFKGRELEGVKTKHPLFDRESVVILGDHVTADAGTGCVHTAPGLGADDYFVGQKYGLGILSPVDDRGCMTAEAGSELEGLFYSDANEKVISMLDELGVLLKATKFTHSYPHDWRTKKPIIFRSTPQWFASIDKIRPELLREIKNVKWHNPWGELRMTNMIKDRGDWCISRQRLWGLPIPVIYNEDGSPILEKEVFDHISNLFREKGSTCWYELDVKDLLPAGYRNEKSPNGGFVKEKDTLDVWFDSGSSHTGVLAERGQGYPSDLYLEGSDQYRGWFNSSLILGVAKHGVSPYKNLVSHGFIVDSKGMKMSKSLGNGVDPNKIVNVQGADILRLWVASIDYQADCKIGDEILKQVSETYRKIRNTCRFLVGNLSNGEFSKFDVNKDAVDSYEFVDLCILEKLQDVTNKYLDCFDAYDFAGAVSEMLNFMTIDLSSFYLDLSKDILYCETYESLRRKQVQNVLYKVLDTVVRLLTPIIPHTMDELYEAMGGDKFSSVLLDMPTRKEVNNELLGEYKNLLTLRSDVLKAIEVKRGEGTIKSSQEVALTLEVVDENVKKTFDKLSNLEQTRLFIVSSVKEVSLNEDKLEVSKVKVETHSGCRCERCWNKFDESEMTDNLCPRCAAAWEFYKDKVNE
ncbi:MAG: isoleucine--tRNA ligase [Bacilli bacterium]|nr:isoleucine--tRNA ligase [Bacilli bacterium]